MASTSASLPRGRRFRPIRRTNKILSKPFDNLTDQLRFYRVP